jgi:hypothetical protein
LQRVPDCEINARAVRTLFVILILALIAASQGQHRYTDVKSERIERAIPDDLAFLTTHPVRQSNRPRQG